MPPLTLVTFPPSLDSELARFLLDHHRVPYREERHTLGFSSLVTLARAGTVRSRSFTARGCASFASSTLPRTWRGPLPRTGG